ncbi:hypothetical protein HPP92_016437 [Vanilla planifolia]|uniref:Cyclin-like domain-containing protein n=1 Tax=Vanilla planifolia TaxID=51239 RepID=A0A835QL69_VANPL|nr:hypothetical protein HPP92_016437 [Vanilla planifolia]
MAGVAAADSTHFGGGKNGNVSISHEERHNYGARWYFSRKEIEENSPSRRHGIDLKKETYFRRSYCTFLQDLGMRLKVPQVTIATAIVFCHRFFLRQSHAKNDRRTIATVCMFLAAKVEETPRPLKDVILVSYEIIHKKDPSAIQRIKQKEVYEQQKELILMGERLVLATLGFDLNVHHPYKPLVEAIKRFKVAQNALAQVAWNFVNDGLRTSLFLQFKPDQIAAGAIFLAAKFLKVKLPSDSEKVWWQEFDVTPRQLEDVSNQMLELYEQNRAAQPSHGNEAEGSTVAANSPPHGTTSVVSDNPPSLNAKDDAQNRRPLQSNVDGNRIGPQVYKSERSGLDGKSGVWSQSVDGGGKDDGNLGDDPVSRCREATGEDSTSPRSSAVVGMAGEKGQAFDAITKIDKDKVKAALEKRRKLRNVAAVKSEVVDEDDFIERELENGIELPVEDEKMHGEREIWPMPLHRLDPTSQARSKPRVSGTENGAIDGQGNAGNAEEGELSVDEHGYPYSKWQSGGGKVAGPKRRPDDKGWSDCSEGDLKRIRCET